MTNYDADTEQILALVERARRIGEQIDLRTTQVKQEVAALHVEWDEEAADAHRAHADTWQREISDMSTALAALEAAARHAHDTYIRNVEHNTTMWP